MTEQKFNVGDYVRRNPQLLSYEQGSPRYRAAMVDIGQVVESPQTHAVSVLWKSGDRFSYPKDSVFLVLLHPLEQLAMEAG